eukprot:Seg1372.9 transcript_id=Seg1372.9/GoldUCD/mRNA.D3Y31 product="Calcium homeostasis modulator protein 6" protein_id=Seg1372.9/GoldUCD/D3Y31
MSAALATYISTASDAIKKQGKSISSCLIIVTTAFLNHILTKSYFKCPNSSHEIYGWSFMIAPGLLLAMLTLLGSTRLSLALTGACRKDIDVPENARGGKRLRTWKFICWNVGVAMAFAVLAFLSWLIVTLLFTETYTCIKIGPSPKTASKDYLAKKEKCDTRSKLIGLSLLVIGLLLAVTINFAIKCCFSDLPEKDLESMHSYEKYEAKAANEEYCKIMKKSAERTGQNIVSLIVKERMEIQQEGKPSKDTNDEDFLAREHIEHLRKFLALRYPRLDNPQNTRLPFCRPEIEIDTFNPDEVDAPPITRKVNERTGTWEPNTSCEMAVCFVKDGNENEDEILANKMMKETLARSVSREH